MISLDEAYEKIKDSSIGLVIQIFETEEYYLAFMDNYMAVSKKSGVINVFRSGESFLIFAIKISSWMDTQNSLQQPFYIPPSH